MGFHALHLNAYRGKSKEIEMNKLLKWTIILRSSYHQWHNLFRIFMVRIIHELGCPPNKTEATHTCMHSSGVWLLVIRTIQAKHINRNHNPVLCFDYGIRNSRIISSEHKIKPMILLHIRIKCSSTLNTIWDYFIEWQWQNLPESQESIKEIAKWLFNNNWNVFPNESICIRMVIRNLLKINWIYFQNWRNSQ